VIQFRDASVARRLRGRLLEVLSAVCETLTASAGGVEGFLAEDGAQENPAPPSQPPVAHVDEEPVPAVDCAPEEVQVGEEPVDRVPEEVLLLVFGFLGGDDLRSIAQVNKRWRRVAGDDELWRRLCFKEGMTDWRQDGAEDDPVSPAPPGAWKRAWPHAQVRRRWERGHFSYERTPLEECLRVPYAVRDKVVLKEEDELVVYEPARRILTGSVCEVYGTDQDCIFYTKHKKLVAVLNVRTGVETFYDVTGAVMGAVLRGDRLAVLSETEASVYSIARQVCLQRFTCPPDEGTPPETEPKIDFDGRYLGVSRGRTLRLWDATTGEQLGVHDVGMQKWVASICVGGGLVAILVETEVEDDDDPGEDEPPRIFLSSCRELGFGQALYLPDSRMFYMKLVHLDACVLVYGEDTSTPMIHGVDAKTGVELYSRSAEQVEIVGRVMLTWEQDDTCLSVCELKTGKTLYKIRLGPAIDRMWMSVSDHVLAVTLVSRAGTTNGRQLTFRFGDRNYRLKARELEG
jgi:hypothetical protein